MKYLKRISALLTAVTLIFSLVLPASAAETNITISTLEDFLSFSEQCTKDTWSYGITVELVSDIDLSGQDFTPIPIFQGVFHGNGHTISGISFDKKGSKVGLFRTLTSSASVADLTVEGTLSPQGSASSIGLLAGENYGTINRCCAKGTVNGQERYDGDVSPHAHFVCTCCGSILDLPPSPPTQGYVEECSRQFGFEAESYEVHVKGLCQACKKIQTSEEITS